MLGVHSIRQWNIRARRHCDSARSLESPTSARICAARRNWSQSSTDRRLRRKWCESTHAPSRSWLVRRLVNEDLVRAPESTHQWRRKHRRVLDLGTERPRLCVEGGARPSLARSGATTQVQSSTNFPGNIGSLGIGPVPRPYEKPQHPSADGTTRGERGLTTGVVVRVAVGARMLGFLVWAWHW